MRWWKSNDVRRWLRIIHRDLGYLMVGICLVYAISGILLTHMNGKDPAYRSSSYTLTLPAGLDQTQLTALWQEDSSRPALRSIKPIDAQYSRLLLQGGVGVYNTADGTLDYEMHQKRELIYWINKLHYNRVEGWSFMADLFAVSLIFFAVSGLFMVPGRKGFLGRGKWFLLVGLLIPAVYVLFT